MFTKNEPFSKFRDALATRGVTIRWGWSGKQNPDAKYDTVAQAIFVGNGFEPSIAAAIVVDHGEGFALYLESPTLDFASDVEAIAKPRETGQ